MFSIQIPIVVAVSKKFTKGDKTYNIIEGVAPGLGIFKQFVDEKLIPDVIEGEQVKANFEVSIDRNFNFALRLKSFEA